MAHQALAPLYAEAGRRGLLVPLDPFRARVGGELALRRMLRALVITEKVHPGRPRGLARITRKAYAVLREGGCDYLLLPRLKGHPFLRARPHGGAPMLDGIRAAADALPAPRRLAAARCALEQPLYGYQEAAVEYLCGAEGPLGPASVAAHRGVAYLQMDTGLGKTRVGCAVVARRAEPALIVVPSSQAIADQWVAELQEVCPDLAVAVYHNPPKGSRRAPPGPATHDVVVVIIDTFRKKGPDFLAGYGTMVLDEAHEYHSAQNGRALWLAQTPAVLGLSATPEDRPDGLDLYVALHLGPAVPARQVPGFDAGAVHFRGEVRLVEYAGHPAHCETATTPAGTVSAILTIGNVIADPYRLCAVATEVARLYHLHETAAPAELARLGLGPRPAAAATPTHLAGAIRRHKVLVFAEHREYLPALRAALAARLGPAGASGVYAPELEEGGPGAPGEISLLRGGVPRAEVMRARSAAAYVVLLTYGFGRRGLDLTDATAIVKATPRRNGTRQLLGRALRRGSDESICRQFVDFVDVRTSLRGQVADRRKVYAEKGYPITKVRVPWEAYRADVRAQGGPCDEGERGVPHALRSGTAADGGSGPGAGGLATATLDELLATVRGLQRGAGGGRAGGAQHEESDGEQAEDATSAAHAVSAQHEESDGERAEDETSAASAASAQHEESDDEQAAARMLGSACSPVGLDGGTLGSILDDLFGP
jgi:superfamily II DNA or RNA helicase